MRRPRWTPDAERIGASALMAFARHVDARGVPVGDDYDALHAWSVRDPAAFWGTYAAWSGLPFDRGWTRVLDDAPMPEVRWFEGASINVARALLGGGGLPGARAAAIVALDEAGGREELGWDALRAHVAAARSALARDGVGPGDRVAAITANRVEAVVLFLACAAIGAVFTSCSPDFGAAAAGARFVQVEPVVLAATPSYRYGGRTFDVRDTATQLAKGLPGLRRLVWLPGVPGAQGASATGARPLADLVWSDWLGPLDDGEPPYASLPFDHPLAVLYSSGTTGAPKAMVHRAGGALLKHHVEQRLHLDVRAGDAVLYLSTLAWMMWNWSLSVLAQGATLLLYDGSPATPDPLALWRALERERATFVGVGARYLHGLAAAGVSPRDAVGLAALRTVASTGSPLAPSGFAYVFDRIKDDVHLASISGGTDVVGCFAIGVPTLPVYDGQLQRPALGVDLAVVDERGAPLERGVGELVCRTPLPSMPLGFWGDPGGARYRATYFERFPGVWHHGDLVERTPEGGVVIHGRSDATLNPGGVRIGTAELYRPLEAFPEVLEACAVGRTVGPDEEVWLLVVLRDGVVLDAERLRAFAARIRSEATPRHVPKRIVQVPALPQTRSGKPMELAVRQLVNGEPVRNRDVMADPSVCERIAAVIDGLTPDGASPATGAGRPSDGPPRG